MSGSPSRFVRLLVAVVLVAVVQIPGFAVQARGAAAATGWAAPSAVGRQAEGEPPTITTLWVTSITPTEATIYFETDQPAEGYVDYGLTNSLGRVRPNSPPTPITKHTVQLTPLTANTRYFVRVRVVTDAGQDISETFEFRTPRASATALLSVKKTNADGTQLLPGACWELYLDAGNGALGSFIAGYCDKYDNAPDSGRTVFPALDAGTYILVEVRSPIGYQIGPDRRFTLTAGQQRSITVKNATGGTRLTVVKEDQTGQRVKGACFIVYHNVNGAPGRFIADGCDDYNGDDGLTMIGSLPPGNYFLWESQVPAGYVRAPLKSFSVDATQATKKIVVRNTLLTDPDNVVVYAVHADGARVAGACFTLFVANGGFVDEQCDGWDGRDDGITTFQDITPGDYVLIEHWAPTDHTVGRRLTFTKSADTTRQLKITQTPGGQRAYIKTVKGQTTTMVTGACYAVYRQSSGNLVSYRCDVQDGNLDGITRFAGLTASTYILVQTFTPPGYARPADRTFTVGDSSLSRTVRLEEGAAIASVSEAPPSWINPSLTPPPTTPTATRTATAKSTATTAPTATPEPGLTGTPVPEPTATQTPVNEPVPTETASPEPTATPDASPVALAGPDQTVDDEDGSGDEIVTLDGSASNDPDGEALTVEWRVDGQPVSTDLVAQVTLQVGTHTAVLTVTDSAGASATDEVIVVIAPAPDPAEQTAPTEEVT